MASSCSVVVEKCDRKQRNQKTCGDVQLENAAPLKRSARLMSITEERSNKKRKASSIQDVEISNAIPAKRSKRLMSIHEPESASSQMESTSGNGILSAA